MPWLKNGGVTEPSDGIHREALCADPWLFWRLRIVEEVVQTTSLTTDDPARRGKVDDFACSKLLKLYTYDICMSMYTYVSLYIYMFDVNDVCIYNIIYYYFTRPHMGGNIRIKHRCGRNLRPGKVSAEPFRNCNWWYLDSLIPTMVMNHFPIFMHIRLACYVHGDYNHYNHGMWSVYIILHLFTIFEYGTDGGSKLRKTGILENRMPRSQDCGFCILPKLGGVVLSFAPWWKHAVWGVVIPPSLGNRYNGSINPYQCGDDHPPILVYNPTLTIVGYIYISHQYVYVYIYSQQ